MLTPLDAEFLDGLMQVNGMIEEGCEEYLRLTDSSSDEATMYLARDLLSQSQSLTAQLQERRGVVGSSDINAAAAQKAVDVTAAY